MGDKGTARTYWEDLVEDLKDPEFLRAYLSESLRVETIDRMVNDLDDVRGPRGNFRAGAVELT